METWFYSGTCMEDGTPITIAARSEFQVMECLRQGLTPVETEEKERKKATSRRASRVGSRKRTVPSS